MTDQRQKPFFVGYLPMPEVLTRFYRILIPVLILAGAAAGFWIAAQQKSAGQGGWDLSQELRLEGVLALEPYPVLHLDNADSVLIVFAGKRGVEELARPVTGQRVAIRGFGIQRGNWSMLEIYSDDAIEILSAETPGVSLRNESQGSVTLAGEIVDSKCYLGVMKPGAGKVHRACAELCILGGMPPMLVATDAAGNRAGYILTNTDGSSAAKTVMANVAVPVTVSGEVLQRGTLRYLRLDDSGIVAQ